MQRDPKAYLWDAHEAIDAVLEFTSGRNLEDFQQDVMLRSAVERQLEIVGEALNQLDRHNHDVANRIPDLPQIVGFRNILIHGYATVDPERVWLIIQQSLPGLRETVGLLFDEEPPVIRS